MHLPDLFLDLLFMRLLLLMTRYYTGDDAAAVLHKFSLAKIILLFKQIQASLNYIFEMRLTYFKQKLTLFIC